MSATKSLNYRDPTGCTAAANVDRREKILAHVSANPGSTIPTISRTLRMERYFVCADLVALLRSGRIAMGGDTGDRR